MTGTTTSAALIAVVLLAAGVAEAQVYVAPQQPGYYYPVAPPAPTPPPQPREETRPHLGLAISGGVMLGVSWLVHAALVSPLAGCDFDSCQDEWGEFRLWGVVPLVGPWVQLGTKPYSERDGWMPYLVIDGLLQVAGLTMLILGVSLRETVTVYAEGPGGFELGVVPYGGADGGGLAAVGRF